MKTFMACVVAFVCFLTGWNSFGDVNVVSEKENVYVIEELRETATQYVLLLRGSDMRIIVDKPETGLEPGKIILYNEEQKENKVTILDVPYVSKSTKLMLYLLLASVGLFLLWNNPSGKS